MKRDTTREPDARYQKGAQPKTSRANISQAKTSQANIS